jgi:membrane carboxypeptidase/penicillin-binding protein PbpC
VAATPTTIEWSVNGTTVGKVSSESSLDWPLRAGRHTIAARDGRGRVVESIVTVR